METTELNNHELPSQSIEPVQQENSNPSTTPEQPTTQLHRDQLDREVGKYVDNLSDQVSQIFQRHGIEDSAQINKLP